ncbi:hypothetical protein P3X46_012238 [Hevea brasiliensis]|uniref:B box-type domain-containing protein n=1 Tax=Hevea brasiliensis TaxID=3981 RepID=A0ABQ9MA11_HEVBR|nr:zinc finger protein CONSTANS-LIKE 4 [Hevea brasiliensis]KAJ9176981.1 hypothetical protein P3X46_012238 [Hevea brasiliensis]
MKKCELCKFPARSYCEADEACLCWDCDAKVHGANFLVARHTRSLLCQICQFLTRWKASGAKLGRTVSVCDGCANRYNLKERDEEEEEDEEEESEESEEANDDVSTEDDDNLSADEEEEEEDEGDSDNQVVPWSSTTPPPAASSSSSSSSSSASSSQESVSGFTRSDGVYCESVLNVKSLKRTRESYTDLRCMLQEDVSRLFSQRRCGRPALKTQAGGGGADGEAIPVDYSLSLRPLKDRRREKECSFQAGSTSVGVIDYLQIFHQRSNGKSNGDSEAVDNASSGNCSRTM